MASTRLSHKAITPLRGIPDKPMPDCRSPKKMAEREARDDFNERTASTTTEARKSAPRAAHCPAPVPPSDALTAFRVGCFCAQSRR